jgi:hypothetical protein
MPTFVAASENDRYRQCCESFIATWKYHHKLKTEQLAYADRTAQVKGAARYHGGDFVYTLEEIPGFWLEQRLRAA